MDGGILFKVSRNNKSNFEQVFIQFLRAMASTETYVSTALHLGNTNCYNYFDLDKDDSDLYVKVEADFGSFLYACH